MEVNAVLVSATVMPKGYVLDLELPAFLPVTELKSRLLESFRVMDPGYFGMVTGLEIRWQKRKLVEEQTLAGLGIWDGSDLEIIALR